MKAIPYLLSGVLIAPGALLGYFIWTVKGSIEQGNIFKVIFFLFNQFILTIEWTMWFLLPAITAWLVLAFLEKYRWLGALGMGTVGILSLVEIFAGQAAPKSFNDISFPLVIVIGVAINIWLVWDGGPWSTLGK
jgi:hypothetical protein